MIHDDARFDTLRLEPVRKKFYLIRDADKLFSDMREAILELRHENSVLREKLQKAESREGSSDELLRTVDSVYNRIVEDASNAANSKLAYAESKAGAIISEAEEKAAEILAGAHEKADAVLAEAAQEAELARRRQEYIINASGAMYSSLREQLTLELESLNSSWQEFLCGFPDDSGSAPSADTAPADLEEKVGLIADLINLDGDDPSEGE